MREVFINVCGNQDGMLESRHGRVWKISNLCIFQISSVGGVSVIGLYGLMWVVAILFLF